MSLWERPDTQRMVLSCLHEGVLRKKHPPNTRGLGLPKGSVPREKERIREKWQRMSLSSQHSHLKPCAASQSLIQDTHTHTLTLAFSDSVTTLGRKAKNRKVKESAETVWLNMVSTGASLQNDLSALLSGKWQKEKRKKFEG